MPENAEFPHTKRPERAGRVRRACDDAPPSLLAPGNMVCSQRSSGTCSRAPRLTPFAVGRKLGSFCLLDSAFIRSKSQYAND